MTAIIDFIDKAIEDLPEQGGVVDISGETNYSIDKAIYINKKNVTIRGAGQFASVFTTTKKGSPMFNFGPKAENVTFEDLALERDDGGYGIALSYNGQVGRVEIRKCSFMGWLTAIHSQGQQINQLIVDECYFHGKGRGTGVGISVAGRDISIRNSYFAYLCAGISIGGVPVDVAGDVISDRVKVVGNTFDGGWYTLADDYWGEKETVTYSNTSVKDTSANFKDIAEGAYVRAMPVLASGNSTTITRNMLTDDTAKFDTVGVKRGYIVRSGKAFGIVSNVVSETELIIEEWLSNETRLPAPIPDLGEPYTVYSVLVGGVAEKIPETTTTDTIKVHRWTTLDGKVSTPSNGTRYELSRNRPQAPLQVSCGHTSISGNLLRRGLADQLTIGGHFVTASDNIIEFGQDMGITIISAKHVICSNNVVRHQGVSPITVQNCEDVSVVNNKLFDSGCGFPGAGLSFYNTKNSVAAYNHLEQLTSANVNVAGIEVASTCSNMLIKDNMEIGFEKDSGADVARLIVTAFSEDTLAAPGNRQPNYIIVSVTDVNGAPVTGLETCNFQVDPMVVGPGGALVNITGVTAGRLPGFYHINAVPFGAQTWKKGVYILAVAVAKGADKGQTLATVLMD